MALTQQKKILYIAGTSRCGSTILANILGSVPGFVHVGEVRFIWDRGFQENWLCSCGLPFLECDYWNDIVSRAYGGNIEYHRNLMSDINKFQIIRLREILLKSARVIQQNVLKQYHNHIETLNRLYVSICEESNCNVVVDSSASPSYGYLLDNVQGMKLYVIHLVRDIRAVVNSLIYRKHKQPTSRGRYQIMGAGMTLKKACYDWVVRNKQIEYLLGDKKSNILFLKYEDFCSAPEEHVRNIVQWVNEDSKVLPFFTPNSVRVKDNHAFSGNPVRFSKGDLTVKCDQSWKGNLSLGQQLFTLTTSLPLMAKYGYFWPAR